VPLHIRNAPTQLMKQLDYGKGYRYAHDEEGAFAAGETYLPPQLQTRVEQDQLYQPTQHGLEVRIAEKLQRLKEQNRAARHADKPSKSD
jgi:putative ATPase